MTRYAAPGDFAGIEPGPDELREVGALLVMAATGHPQLEAAAAHVRSRYLMLELARNAHRRRVLRST